MSRSGYNDDCEGLGLWRGAVASAISGKRGQAFLREMAAALDAMPIKELIADEVVSDDSRVCAIGSVALARRMSVTDLDVHDADGVAKRFGIARALAAEIAYENDECGPWGTKETPTERWTRMREWVADQLKAATPMTVLDDNLKSLADALNDVYETDFTVEELKWRMKHPDCAAFGHTPKPGGFCAKCRPEEFGGPITQAP